MPASSLCRFSCAAKWVQLITNRADVLIHLLCDFGFVDYPEWIEWHMRACLARSIPLAKKYSGG